MTGMTFVTALFMGMAIVGVSLLAKGAVDNYAKSKVEEKTRSETNTNSKEE